jgi:hypothetical protein
MSKAHGAHPGDMPGTAWPWGLHKAHCAWQASRRFARLQQQFLLDHIVMHVITHSACY